MPRNSRGHGSTPKPLIHGTTQGYQAHKYRGEEPCQACKTARAQESTKYKEDNPEYAARQNRRRKAEGRAFRRLKRMFPVEFYIIYEEEIDKEEKAYAQGQSITGRGDEGSSERVPLHEEGGPVVPDASPSGAEEVGEGTQA